MAKEVIRPEQYSRVQDKSVMEDIDLQLSEEQLQELSELYDGMFDCFKPGKIITGKVINVDSDGVLVDIDFKSRGMIPKYEFGDHELKTFKEGDDIEVMIDTLESAEGNVVLSYEKAKAMRAWNDIMKYYEEDKYELSCDDDEPQVIVKNDSEEEIDKVTLKKWLGISDEKN